MYCNTKEIRGGSWTNLGTTYTNAMATNIRTDWCDYGH